ncbi:MAG: GDP-mannose 4,6-dehydratase, partial [Microgenomates group bacterium]
PHMRLDDGRFTINLIDAYLNKKPFKMYGDGSSTRSFCYIDDLVSGIIKVYQTEKAIGEVINLGNPTEYTLSDAIKTFEGVIGSELPKEYIATPPDDPKKRKPDIAKAKSLLGWEPTIDFKTGIAKTLKYYEAK